MTQEEIDKLSNEEINVMMEALFNEVEKYTYNKEANTIEWFGFGGRSDGIDFLSSCVSDYCGEYENTGYIIHDENISVIKCPQGGYLALAVKDAWPPSGSAQIVTIESTAGYYHESLGRAVTVARLKSKGVL